MAKNKKFQFDEWWEAPKTKRVVGAIYSLGASVVIIGAMFKILHLPGAGVVLGVGMITEAFLFAIGIFDKPHTEYHWQNIFPALLAKEAQPLNLNGGGVNMSSSSAQAGNMLDDEEMQRLTDGIKNLSETANQLSALSSVAASTETLVKNMDAAAAAAAGYAGSQVTLNNAAKGLENAYHTVSADMDSIVKQTKTYGEKVETINSHLASINSVYELQLRNIQAQSETLGEQSEKVGLMSGHLNNICNEVSKMQLAVVATAEEAEKYKVGATKLTQQISELNKVYGNMLNALG